MINNEYECEVEKTLLENGYEGVMFLTDYSYDDALVGVLSFSTLFDVDFGELNEKNFCLYLMVCSPYLEVKASLKRLKALTSKHGEHEK